jgi:hypothetical protein
MQFMEAGVGLDWLILEKEKRQLVSGWILFQLALRFPRSRSAYALFADFGLGQV